MPQWLYNLDVSKPWQDEDLPFSEKRDQVVYILRQSVWHTAYERAALDLLPNLVDELSDALDNREFNRVFSDIYDLADDDRAWIQTW